jgi:hypothetical protein
MAQRNSSGRGGTATATRNRPSSSDRITESDIGQLKVDEIRGQLRKRGISGTSALRKPALVQTLVKTLRAEKRSGGGTARKSTGPARKSTAPAKKASAAGGGGVSRGRASSKSLKYSQQISSPDERPERLGRSLVTRSRDVIQAWARARDAKPATIEGTEKGTRPGVLTFDFPGYREGGRLRQITWDQWFKSFDGRRLNFIYQEQRTDARQSNFFRVENPDREDA